MPLEGSDSERSVSELLQAGIAAARSGRNEQARDLLRRVTERDAENITAWLWLSGVLDTPEEQRECLEQVLALDPGNEPARRGLARLPAQPGPEQLLRQGIQAAEAGQDERARELLLQVVDQDETNVTAWLWLSSVVDTLVDREIALQNVLALDPGNRAALKGLESLRRERVPPPTFSTPLAPPEPEVAAAAAAEGVAIAVPGMDFDNEYLCPYCGAETEPEDKKCPNCRTGLWVKTRKREKPSTWFWMALSAQIFDAGWFLFLLYVLLAGVLDVLQTDHNIEIYNPLVPFRVYLGLTGGVSAEVVNFTLETVSRLEFFSILIPVLVSGVLLVGLVMRWMPIYYLFFVNAAYTLVLGVADLIQGEGVPYGVAIALLLFVATIQMRDDFVMEKRRRLLRLDPAPVGGLDYVVHGQRYMQLRKWATAALHLERAAMQMQGNIDVHLALAASYIGMNRHDLATKAVEEARRIDPRDSRVAELTNMLERRRGR